MCLHSTIEPYEDESSHGACVDCGEEFELRGPAPSDDSTFEPEEEERVDSSALPDDAIPPEFCRRAYVLGDPSCGARRTSRGVRSRCRRVHDMPRARASDC